MKWTVHFKRLGKNKLGKITNNSPFFFFFWLLFATKVAISKATPTIAAIISHITAGCTVAILIQLFWKKTEKDWEGLIKFVPRFRFAVSQLFFSLVPDSQVSHFFLCCQKGSRILLEEKVWKSPNCPKFYLTEYRPFTRKIPVANKYSDPALYLFKLVFHSWIGLEINLIYTTDKDSTRVISISARVN